MRKRYRWNPETMRQEPIEPDPRWEGVQIMPDIPDFVSTVDGSIIHGRKSLREHNKRNNVTNAADFTQTWQKQAAERAKAFTPGAGYDKRRRIEALVHSYDKLTRSTKR